MMLFLAACARAAEMDYAAMLNKLWSTSDADKDDELNLAEFDVALGKIGVEASIFTKHDKKSATLLAALDKDSSGGLTQEELAAAVTDFPDYKDDLIAAFTNGAGQVPTGIPEVSSAVTASTAKVTMEISVSGKVSDIYAGQRKAIKEWFASKCGVTTAEVIVTFLAATDSSDRRKLQSTDSVDIKGTAFVADDAAAIAAADAMPQDVTGFQSASAFSDFTVTSAEPVEAQVSPELPISSAAIVGAVLLVAGLAMCFIASSVSKSKAKAAGAQGGCCKAGCCSFFAVKPWAFGEFVALLAIAGTIFYLYTNMAGVTTVILGLIDTLQDLTESNLPAIQDLTSALPDEILDQVIELKGQVALLPFAVMGPGAVAIIALLCGSLCPMHSGHKGSYAVTKCFIFLADIFLILSLVFYSIFAGLAVLLKFPPEVVAAQIRTITGMCDTIPPWISQMVADNTAALNQLDAAGQDVSELQTQLEDVSGLSTSISEGCEGLSGFIEEFILLFLPGVLCIVAIVFALFVNNTLCCATGCCKGPPKAASKSEEATQQV